MRPAILLLLPLLPLVATQCITTALHETAFPDGSEYDYADETIAAAAFERGFRICMRGPQGVVELRVQAAASDQPLTYILPLTAVNAFSDRAWQSSVTPGCSIQNSPTGRPAGSGSLVLSEQLVVIPHSEKRAAMSTASVPASARLASIEISADNKHLRVLAQGTAPVILKRAGPGDFEPGFSPYYEDQWIPASSSGGETWRPLEILDQTSLAVYFIARDGQMHLRTFSMPDLSESSIVYVAHLAERPQPHRPYLIPLYPFAVILDVLTLALQVTVWYEDARRTAACFNW